MNRVTLIIIALLLVSSQVIAGGPSAISDRTVIMGDNEHGYSPIRLDSVTRALTQVDYAHHEIHEGDSYTVSSYSGSLGSGNTFNIYVKTPPLPKLLHIEYQSDATGEGELMFVAEPTVSASGTSQEIFNRRRDSANTCGATAFVNCSYSGGKVLRLIRAGIGKSIPGGDRSTSEFILKPSANYVLVFTSRATGIFVSLKMDWYCHADY